MKEKELIKLVEPLQEWLINNYNPHCSILIKDGEVKILSDELSIPLNIED
ncbi:MAG: hypothetical protein MR598_03145 [Erysipelotrichaceae bacterium]|nr:hypothetical protein [Erysipelotrichaceae bacterium]